MSKKIYISPIIEIERIQVNLEICAASPCLFCDSDPCICDESGDITANARLRGGYYEAEIHQAEFGNLW